MGVYELSVHTNIERTDVQKAGVQYHSLQTRVHDLIFQ